MRFSVAAAILSNNLPHVKSRVIQRDFSLLQISPRQQSEDTHLHGIVEQRPQPIGPHKSRGQAYSNQKRKHRQSKLGRQNLQNTPFGRSSNIGETQLQECDPSSSLSNLNADTGILSSCGFGVYCVESELSTRGGFCMPPSSSTSQVDTNRVQGRHRYLQESAPLFNQTLENYCVPESQYNQTCNCVVDDVASTVEVICTSPDACTTEPSVCGVNITNCVKSDFQFNLTGLTEYSRRFCYEFTQPYEQKVCYESSAVDINTFEFCSMEFNGVVCNSCDIQLAKYEVCQPYELTNQTICYNITTPCYIFDCTNNKGGHSGNGCLLQGRTMYEYLETYACVDECNICGEGLELTNPDGNISIPGYDYMYNCGDLQTRGSKGYFTQKECLNVQKVAGQDCGCNTEAPTESLANSTDAPTVVEPPSFSPSEIVQVTEAPEIEDSKPPSSNGYSFNRRQTSFLMMISISGILFGTLAYSA